VIAEDESGKTIRANAKAVIIATGGFGNNKEMIKEHTGFNLGEDVFVMTDRKMTGDGIRLAWEAGAAKEAMGMHLIHHVPGPGIVGPMPWMVKNQVGVIQWQPYLWVNQQGERFFDESIATHRVTFTANAIARQKGRCAYLIFDESTRKSMEEKGFDHMPLLFPGNERLVDFDAQIKGLQDSGNKNVFVADTLEELAQKMGIKLDALQKTVDEYNRFCEKGHDDLLAKDPKFLCLVKVPKFYAFRNIPSAYGTLGGIKVNERMEVLNKEQDVIPGLYAAGYDANIIYGDTPDYDHFKFAGSALGFALNSGRIAGENAARYIAG
jgi:fumarate reductase flavoprotein subunit